MQELIDNILKAIDDNTYTAVITSENKEHKLEYVNTDIKRDILTILCFMK